jgi:O-Antigen ligase
MGKASRAKRPGVEPAGRPIGVPAAAPTGSKAGQAAGATAPTGPTPAAPTTRLTRPATLTRSERRALRAAPAPATGLDRIVARWDVGLLALAATFWLLGHVPAIASLAIPAWIVTGLALGLLQPWFGLLLTIAVVPFLGGAIDAQYGEVLRVVPIYGAAARVLLDRFVLGPSLGDVRRQGPPWWVVAAAIAAMALYAYTAVTGYFAVGQNPGFLDYGLHWVAGGPMALMAAWIAASHLVAGRDRMLTNVVLGTTVVGCVVAVVAWIGVPGLDFISFPGSLTLGTLNPRLAALGYPTPTAMGIATALPFAAAAALPYRRWLAFAVIGLGLGTMILTGSRGPLIAIGAGTVLAVLASGRVGRRSWIAGIAAGAIIALGLIAVRYGTTIDAIVQGFSSNAPGDVARVDTWIAAISITIANPLVGGGWRSIERFGNFAQEATAYAHDIVLHGFAEGGLPLGITNATVILYSAWQVWRRRHTMAPYLIAGVVTFLVCGFWDIPQVRSYAAVMGGIAMGMAAGPLIGRGDDRAKAVIGARAAQ